MRLYIIRHADPDYPNKTITPAGHLEAKALAAVLKRQGLDRIYCSPLGRAVHTMEYTRDALGLSFEIAEWTQELGELGVDDTPWGRLMAWDIPGEVIRGGERPPTADNWHALEYFARPEIRSRCEQVARESDAFLAKLGYERVNGRYRCVAPNNLRVAVFCHGGFGLVWLAHLLALPMSLVWSGFWMPPSSVTTILMECRTKDWAVPRCIGFGDVGHLREAGLAVQPSGLKANTE